MEQQNMEPITQKNHTSMDSYNQTHQSKSLEDIMYQRMKNRERQRRYRERKRLLADMNNKSVQMIEPTTPQLSQPPSSAIVPYQPVTRIRRTRDWKKDARRAHMAKQENAEVSGMINSSENMSNSGEKSKVKSSRRDWKAEARNKKGETK